MALKDLMSAHNGTSDMLLFAWVSEVEGSVRSRRPRSLLGPERTEVSPLIKAKTHVRRTFSAGYQKERIQQVKEVQDACLWLTEAGFPQYVQMFYDGQFPVNLTQLEVEPDHSFLDQASIEALIRRINTLNRFAYLADEVKNDPEDDTPSRALSRRWRFRKATRQWFRGKSDSSHDHHHHHQRQQRVQATRPSSAPHNCGCGYNKGVGGPQRPMLVSDLSCSLTSLPNSVKTYSFTLSEERGAIPESPLHGYPPTGSPDHMPHTPTIVISDTSVVPSAVNGTANDSTKNGLCSTSSDSSAHLNSSGEETIPQSLGIGSLESFSNGIMKAFESNLRQLHQISLSLPDVFGDVNSSHVSSCSVSTTSIMESSSKDDSSVMNDSRRCSTPSINPDVEYRLAVSSDPMGAHILNGCNACSSFVDDMDGGNDTPSPNMSDEESTSGELSDGTEEKQRKSKPKKKKSNKSFRFHRRVSRTKWHSFQKMHSFRLAINPVRTFIPLEELSVGQVEVLRKLSLLKLTAMVERYNGKANIAKIMKEKKPKGLEYARSEKSVFGVPLWANVQQHGHPLPPAILLAIRDLKKRGLSTVGLFRRSAAKPRVEILRQLVDDDPEGVSFEDFSACEVADLVKLYFRELPEPLVSHKLTELIISINGIPEHIHLQALQALMLLMPDENRVALETLLLLLREVADHCEDNQMDASNLGLCLSPTLFSNDLAKVTTLSRKSFRRSGTHSPSPISASKEVLDSVATSHCLSVMIQQCNKLFMVAADMVQTCNFTHLEVADPVPFQELGMDRMGNGNYSSFIESTVSNILKELTHKFKGWIYHSSVEDAEVSFLEVDDGIPMHLWRASVEVPACADHVLKKLWSERHVWDSDVTQCRVVFKIDDQTEVFQYVTSAMSPYGHRDHCTFRSWRYDRASDCYIVVATSVTHPLANLLAGIRSIQMASDYVIEPLDENNCRVTHLCRVDMRGHSADYYRSNYGSYLASHSVLLLRNMIQQLEELDFLETPV